MLPTNRRAVWKKLRQGWAPAESLSGLVLICCALAACGDEARLPEQATTGPTPTIAAPSEALIPTINIAKAVGWAEGERPRAAQGFEVNALARDLDHPRWLYVLPNGDVLVAESTRLSVQKKERALKALYFVWR